MNAAAQHNTEPVYPYAMKKEEQEVYDWLFAQVWGDLDPAQIARERADTPLEAIAEQVLAIIPIELNQFTRALQTPKHSIADWPYDLGKPAALVTLCLLIMEECRAAWLRHDYVAMREPLERGLKLAEQLAAITKQMEIDAL